MTNHWRGEVQATLAGKPYRLCLTLGALAELEAALSGEDIIAFTERLSEGRIRASDIIHVLGCALRGGGHDVADEDAAQMMPAGGLSEAMQLVARLISLSFGGADAGGGEAASEGKLIKTEPSPGDSSSL